MAVSITVTLPETPADGSVTYVPLGGDGFSSPQAAYAVRGLGVTGASGGGSARMTINMDPRYVSLVAWVTASAVQVASADADVRIVITPRSGQQIPTLVHSGPIEAISATVSSSTLGFTWVPPPMMLPGAGQEGRIVCDFLNVENDVYDLHALIYLFNIRARELTPTGHLLWARGST